METTIISASVKAAKAILKHPFMASSAFTIFSYTSSLRPHQLPTALQTHFCRNLGFYTSCASCRECPSVLSNLPLKISLKCQPVFQAALTLCPLATDLVHSTFHYSVISASHSLFSTNGAPCRRRSSELPTCTSSPVLSPVPGHRVCECWVSNGTEGRRNQQWLRGLVCWSANPLPTQDGHTPAFSGGWGSEII